MIVFFVLVHCVAFLILFSFLAEKEDSKLLLFLRGVIPNSKNGNLLYQQTLSLNSNRLNSSKQIELIQYKYFTEIINELVQNARKYGTGIHLYLPDIKKGLIKDIQLDKKVFALFLGGVYQFLLVFFLGLIFISIVMNQLNAALGILDFIIPISLQILGLVSFSSLYIYLRKIRFQELFKYIFKLYQMRTLAQAQLPLKEVFEKVSPDELSDKGDLKYFKEKIFLLFSDMKNRGVVDLNDLDIYINELWQYIELRFEKFNKELAGVKLTHLAIFSLGGYLMLLMQIFSRLSL